MLTFQQTMLMLKEKLTDQVHRDEAFDSKDFETRNFWGMYDKNNYPYIMLLDNHPDVKRALHISTCENLDPQPMLKGTVADWVSREKLSHRQVLDRVLNYCNTHY